MRVLVVEDDPSVRETLGMVLEAYDHQPDLVDDGEHALKYLETTWPDVMLLDLSLPGMSGEEVYQAIRDKFGRIPPTIVVSAVQEGENRARHLPGALFLAKPYTLEELANILELAASSRAA
ncbi:MAG TPA: response regulator [Bdellovibrionota bacterium]|nr:response regulator [Bdellovibrionota bacterium]